MAAAFAANVRRAVPADPGRADLAAALVDAFLPHISDLPSEFSPTHRTATAKTARRKAREPEAFDAVITRAAGYPTAPLGSVPAMVEAELHDRLLLIERVVADLRHRPAA